jgi:hypothetical protein
MDLMRTLEVETLRLKDELQIEKRVTQESKYQLDKLAKGLEAANSAKQQLEQSIGTKDDLIRSLQAEISKLQRSNTNNPQVQSKPIQPPARNSSFNALQGIQTRAQPSSNGSASVPIPSDVRKPAAIVNESVVVTIPAKLDLADETIYDGAGQLDREQIQSFKSSIEELLKCSRIDNPANVLIFMKSVVSNARAISDSLATAQTVETNSAAVALIRKNIADNLTALISASKAHASTGKPLDPTGIDGAANNLVVDVVSAVHLLKIRIGPTQSQDQLDSSKAAYDQSIVDLRTFLEEQTDLIVQNIQTLLQAMRQSAFGKDFSETIKGINGVVGNLVGVSRDTLDKPQTAAELRQRGEEILRLLEGSNGRLAEMGEAMIKGDQKPSKQKLASAAYEVAKYTKELVSLFDTDHQ